MDADDAVAGIADAEAQITGFKLSSKKQGHWDDLSKLGTWIG